MARDRSLVWDETVATTLADYYVSASASLAGAAAEPLLVTQLTTTCRPVIQHLPSWLSPGWFVAQMTVHHDREKYFLFQRLSVIRQHYAVLLHESFVQSDGLDL